MWGRRPLQVGSDDKVGRNPVWMLKPQSTAKRRTVGRRLTMRRGRMDVFSEEVVKHRLQAIRSDSAEHLEDLVLQLVCVCRDRYGVEVYSAETAQAAARYIAQLAGPHKRVLVNRSAVVNEIRPALLEQGLVVVDTYDEEFHHPDEGVQYYWEIEIPEPEAIWESFSQRMPSPQPHPTGDSVALIGVSSIGAADGTAYLVEHLGNISRLLQEARKVVLVVGLDKIAPTAEDAQFVAQAMALFGAPSIAMTTASHGHAGEDGAQTRLSRPGEDRPQEWHLVLLDNRRRWLLHSPFRSLFACIGCRACMRECPTFPYFGDDLERTPRDQLWKALRGDGYRLTDCVSCGRCKALCPMDIDLPMLISQVKGQHSQLKDEFFKRIDVLFALSSATAPLANFAFSARVVRYPVEWVSGLDRRRVLPRFHRRSFEDWARSRHARSSGEPKVVYYYGCYVNYTDPSLGRIVVELLERNGCEVVVPPQTCCGVAAFWYGDRKLARQYARKTVRSLLPWVERGYRVVVTCPSCGLALKHDFPLLFPDSDGVRHLAENTLDVPSLIFDLLQQGKWERPRFPLNLRIGYHTPCHLRIRGGGKESMALLATIPGLEVVEVDRGCCGLAGSYGLKAGNYVKSMAIGERIAEFLRSGGFDAVATDCAGCEMQIHAVSGLPVYHPLKLLWQGHGGVLEKGGSRYERRPRRDILPM